MSSLLDKIKKNSTIKESEILETSKFFTNVGEVATRVPAINVALSGKIDGGLKRGITLICGPSRHFKSLFALIMAEAYMREHPDAICIFYDSEFGSPKSYFESAGIDPNRVVHCPVQNLEQLKHDIVVQLDSFERKDKVIILIDSIGNLASFKEATDALDGKQVQDMTRARAMKSLFRIITPMVTIKDIPLVAINHIYMEMGLYPKAIVGGGQGPMLASENVWIIGRSQEKGDDGLLGYNFNITIEKSRYVREKSKIPITVLFDGGLSVYSGLLEMAMEAKLVIKPKNGWYQRINAATGEVEDKLYRWKDTQTAQFWDPLLASSEFKTWVNDNYKVTTQKLITDEELLEEVGKLLDESSDEGEVIIPLETGAIEGNG